jgi:hypothetical protein
MDFSTDHLVPQSASFLTVAVPISSSVAIKKMADTLGAPDDGVAVVEVSPEYKRSVITEKPVETSSVEKVQIEVGQESFGAPPDDEVEYVKGFPVIRSGTYSPHIRLVVAVANCFDQVLMSPNSSFLPETMGILR